MPKLHARALAIALAVAFALSLAIILGSRNLRDFDSALIGYAVATVFAVLGVTYRFVLWLARPPTRLYWVRGWQLFASWENFRRYGTLIPRVLLNNLAVQTFILPRGPGRWIMHLSLFWGVVLASAVTFPLVFGWLRFRAAGEGVYESLVLGVPIVAFQARSVFGFLVIHILDVAAVLVLVGVGIALWRRWTDREVMAGQEFGFDFVPLFLLAAISITGLLLTASSMLWWGAFYWFISLAHQALVILTILYIPFGKFWHLLERPASIGIELYKTAAGVRPSWECARCHQKYVSPLFIADLKQTLRDLNQDYTMGPEGQSLQDFCPECKRVLRANTYFEKVERGFL